MRHHDDQELMVRVQAGDRQAFEALYSRYARPLLNFFYQMCFDRTAAEDYLQETFLRVWRFRDTYRPIGKLSTWLFQVAKNHWLNEREKLLRRPFATGVGGEEGQERWGNVADPRRDTAADAAAAVGETAAALQEAIASLSEKLRLVFVMARYQNLPYAQIATVLEIPVGTVKSRMAQAEKTLRARLSMFLGD